MAAVAIAIGASLHSLSLISLDHHLSFHFFPQNKPKSLTTKTVPKTYTYAPLSSPFRPILFCASTAISGDLDLNQQQEEEEADPEKDKNVESKSAEEARLYVGNLPFSLTSKQLYEIFSEAGRVVSVEIVYDRVTDRSRGFSFVTMGSAKEAKEAIRLFDGAEIGGRTAKVNFPEVPRGGEREVMIPKIRSSYQGFVDSPHKIYAGNLGWELTSQGLREAFEQQPGFLSAKVIYDRDSGRSRGFGFITFASREEVDSALNNMNGMEVEGRPLRLNLADQRVSVSPPTAVEDSSESGTENS